MSSMTAPWFGTSLIQNRTQREPETLEFVNTT
jgi:hypothetical protein